MAWQDRPYYGDQMSSRMRLGFTPPTPMALYIMGACVVVFILQAMTSGGGSVADSQAAQWGWLDLRGMRAVIQPWRWITYQYVHGDAMHIFWNLLGIYFFLSPLEQQWGKWRALAFYTAGGLAAGVLFAIIGAFGPLVPLMGASGSIFAALGACAVLFPEKQILLFFIIPISIRVIAVLAALLWTLSIIGHRDLSAAAHLGGLIFGVGAPLLGGPLWTKFTRHRHQSRTRKAVLSDKAEQEAVDRILHKVAQQGMQSLTWLERRTLKKATEHQRQRDLEMARKYR